jgi:hypothetical protein
MCPLPGSPLLLVRLHNPLVQNGVILAHAVWTIGCLLLAVVLPSLGTWQKAFSASYTYTNTNDDDDDDDNYNNSKPYN